MKVAGLLGSHDGDRDAGAAEDGLEDFAVAVARDDHAILNGVAADDAAGGNAEADLPRRRGLTCSVGSRGRLWNGLAELPDRVQNA
jgi:hypothetical protein